ncbi:MAG TPA: glucokinase [Candidatus Acidoferrales bacterium]|nr:glucokinase [Candidatus Acidoferrales bacterium]
MILAGDIGGTKCNLALFEGKPGSLRRVAYRRFASKDYTQLGDLVSEFVREVGIGSGTRSDKITAAGFGVAGPVIDNQVHATNLPWVVDGLSLARLLGIKRVVLLNDLEATGYSIAHLSASELCGLNDGKPEPRANRALIAAGTGLGEAILFWDGSRHVVAATEGGHTDLAPRTEQEIELLRFLKKREEYVSWEIVLSGRGFPAIHEFLDPAARHPGFDVPDADPAPEITRRALEGSCPVCVSTLDIWTALYGAEAGNLALKTLARGGVYVAGGIAVKILPKMKDGTFVRAFCEKEKFGILLSQIPIYVVLNEEAPLWGAAAQAASTPGA